MSRRRGKKERGARGGEPGSGGEFEWDWIFGAETDKPPSGEHFRRGMAMQQKGNLAEAIRHYDRALRDDPGDVVSCTNKAAALLDCGRAKEAERACKKALTLNRSYYLAHDCMGLIMRRTGRPKRAVQHYDKALALCVDPPNRELARMHTNKGAALLDLNRLEESVKCCDEAIKANPDYAAAYANKGAALFDLDRLEESVKCCDEAVRRDPGCVYAYVNKGAALSKLDKLEESVKCFDEAIKADPSCTAAYTNKGMSLYSLNRLEESIACCDEAIGVDPNYTQAYIDKSAALFDLGRRDEAIKCLIAADLVDPGLGAPPASSNALGLKPIRKDEDSHPPGAPPAPPNTFTFRPNRRKSV